MDNDNIISQIDKQAQEIYTINQKLDRQACTIKKLIEYINVLEMVLIHPITPANPDNILVNDDNILTFTLENAHLVEFIDIRIDEDKWIQFWASWSGRTNTFKLDGKKIIINLFDDVPKSQLEIFTRYDRFTNNSDSGHAIFKIENKSELNVIPMDPINIRIEDNILYFTLENANVLEFIDIRIDEDKWIQFWASWSGRTNTFKLDENTISVDLSECVPKKTCEIFTRYDYYTHSSASGFAFFQL